MQADFFFFCYSERGSKTAVNLHLIISLMHFTMRTDPAIEERNEILELHKLLKKVHHEAAEGLQQPNIILIQKNH